MAVGIELRQAIEQERRHFPGRYVGGERRVEGAGVVGLVVDQPPSLSPAAGFTMAGGEKAEEQGALRGVEKVDSAEQVSQHSGNWQTTSIARPTLPVGRRARGDNRPRRSRTVACSLRPVVRRSPRTRRLG